MTIYELKALNQKNGGHFFDKDTVKASGEILRNMRVYIYSDTLVQLVRPHSAPLLFNRKTGRAVIRW